MKITQNKYLFPFILILYTLSLCILTLFHSLLLLCYLILNNVKETIMVISLVFYMFEYELLIHMFDDYQIT